jgi:hypothetical protein
MTKKQLLRRIEALEACLGRAIEMQDDMIKHIKDLEEIVFDCEVCNAPPGDTPLDRRAN